MEFLIGFFTVFVLSYIVGGLTCRMLGMPNDVKGLLKYICYTIIGYFTYLLIIAGVFVMILVYAVCSLIGCLLV